MQSVKSPNLDEYSRLFNGKDRNFGDEENGVILKTGHSVVWSFDENTRVIEIKLVFDSDLTRKSYGLADIHTQYSTRCNTLDDSPQMFLPKTLVKSYEIKLVTADGERIILENRNLKRSVIIPIESEVTAVSLTVLGNWGNTDESRVFAFEVK